MPITVEIVGANNDKDISKVYTYFKSIDARFSPYKRNSELNKINKGLKKDQWSDQMKEVMKLCDQTKQISGGYFDIKRSDGTVDTSGLVKGWAIDNAAKILLDAGIENFYIEAGGDIAAYGNNEDGEPWLVGIRNPFEQNEIVKRVKLSNKGMATSGLYVRGDHIYDPMHEHKIPKKVASLSVIGPNIFEADRFATAAFAMDSAGVSFIAALPELEAYQIDQQGVATFTQGFNNYVV